MAKITGPLMSAEASGLIGERLTFSNRKSGRQVRFQKAQKTDNPTWKQTDEQSLYRVIYARWLSFTIAEKKVYNDLVIEKNLKMSGWNYFLKLAMASPLTYLGLCGYWSMNRTGFGTVLDLSKNGNAGTLMPTYPSNCPLYVASKNKKMLKALYFDGLNDYVNIGATTNLNNITGAITIELWFNLNTSSMPKTHRMMCDMNAANSSYISVITSVEPFLSLSIGGLQKTLHSFFYPLINTWYHLVATWNADKMRIYINGALKNTSVSYTGALNFSGNKYIGKYAAAGYEWSGLIDEFRIYNRALGATEILKLYNLFK